MNNIPFLSLKDVTAIHGAEINEAVTRVVNGGFLWSAWNRNSVIFSQR